MVLQQYGQTQIVLANNQSAPAGGGVYSGTAGRALLRGKSAASASASAPGSSAAGNSRPESAPAVRMRYHPSVRMQKSRMMPQPQQQPVYVALSQHGRDLPPRMMRQQMEGGGGGGGSARPHSAHPAGSRSNPAAAIAAEVTEAKAAAASEAHLRMPSTSVDAMPNAF